MPNVNEVVREMTREQVVPLVTDSLKQGVALLGPSDGGGKKKKKKNVKAKGNPTAELMIIVSTGCLRHLACDDANKIRLVACGMVELLNQMFESSPSMKIRSNARYILNLLAMLDACYDYMVECGTPGNFLSLSQKPFPISDSAKEDVLGDKSNLNMQVLQKLLLKSGGAAKKVDVGQTKQEKKR